VTVDATWRPGGDDVVDKDIKLLNNHYSLTPYYLMNGNRHYVIVLKKKLVIVQALQPDTQPCTSTNGDGQTTKIL